MKTNACDFSISATDSRPPATWWRILGKVMTLVGVIVGAFIGSALPPWGSPAMAQTKEVFTGFVDPDRVVMVDAAPKRSYLVGGTSGPKLVRYTDESWAGSEFGFSAEQTDLSAYRNTLSYPNGSTGAFARIGRVTGGVIVDLITGFVGGNFSGQGSDVIAVAVVLHPDGIRSVWVVGTQAAGWQEARQVLSFPASAPAPSMVLLNQDVGGRHLNSSTLVLTSGPADGLITELRSYEIRYYPQAALASGLVQSLPLLGQNIDSPALGATFRSIIRPADGVSFLAIAHRPTHESIVAGRVGDTLIGSSTAFEQNQQFISLEARPSNDGPLINAGQFAPALYLHTVNENGSISTAAKALNPLITQRGSNALRFSDVRRAVRGVKQFEVLYDGYRSSFLDRRTEDAYMIAVRNRNFVFTTRSGTPVDYRLAPVTDTRNVAVARYEPANDLEPWRWRTDNSRNPPLDAGLVMECHDDSGFDFRSYHSGNPNDKPLWNMVCVEPARSPVTPGSVAGAIYPHFSGSGARLHLRTAKGRSTDVALMGETTALNAMGGPGRGGSVGTTSGAYFTDPKVHITFPCMQLLSAYGAYEGGLFRGDQCTALVEEVGSSFRVTDPGHVGVTVMVQDSPVDDRKVANSFLRDLRTPSLFHATADAAFDPGSRPNVFSWPKQFLNGISDRTLASLPRLQQSVVVDLNPAFDNCRKGPNFRLGTGLGACNVPSVITKPVPVVVLMAPPVVANSGQDGNTFPSTYSLNTSQGQGQTRSVGRTAGVSVGASFDYEVAATEFSVGYERSVEQSVGSSTTSSIGIGVISEFENGIVDTVVVSQTRNLRFSGRLLSSSEGLAAVGSAYDIFVPEQPSLNAYSWQEVVDDFGNTLGLRAELPEYFAPPTAGRRNLFAGLDKLFSHKIGDPGSYPSFANGGAELSSTQTNDARCLGNVAGTRDASSQLGMRRTAPNVNSFVNGTRPSPANAILVGAPFNVSFGGSAQGTVSFALAATEGRSYNESHGVSFAFEQSFGPSQARFTTGVSGGVSEGVESSFETTVESSFGSQIANFSFSRVMFPFEGYTWRPYLCTVDLGAASGLPSLPVSVLGFTVDGYQGLGGFEALGEITPVTPLGVQALPATSSRNPLLVFDQPEGSVARYEFEIETLNGVKITRALNYCPPNQACNLNRPDRVQFAPASVSQPLAANTTYRWRVTAVGATTPLGRSGPTEWQYFRTNTSIPALADITTTRTQLTFNQLSINPGGVLGQLLPPSVIRTRLTTINGVVLAGQQVVVTAIDRTNFAARVVCDALTDANGFSTCSIPASDGRTPILNNAGSFRARYSGFVGPGESFSSSEVRRVP